MNTLPTDLLINIISQQSLFNVSQIAICCRLFLAIVNDTYFWRQWIVYHKLDLNCIFNNDISSIITNLKNAYCWKMKDKVTKWFHTAIHNKLGEFISIKNTNPDTNKFCISNIPNGIDDDLNDSDFPELFYFRCYFVKTNQTFTPFRNKIRVKNLFKNNILRINKFKNYGGYDNYRHFALNRGKMDDCITGDEKTLTLETDKIQINQFITDDKTYFDSCFSDTLIDNCESIFNEYTIEIDFDNKKIIFENIKKNYRKEVRVENPYDLQPYFHVCDENAVEIY